MSEEWDGKGRRFHDDLCDKKWVERYEDIKNLICAKTKGGAVWRYVMRPIIMLLLVGAVGGHLYNYSQAQGNTQVHATNTTKIDHLEKEDIRQAKVDDDIKKEHKELAKTVGRVDRNLSKLLGAMGVKAEKAGP